MAEGKLIAFEGIDGSGVSTQADLLRSWLLKKGLECYLTKEPSEGPLGANIRLALAKRLVYGGGGSSLEEPSHQILALMFAADRLDHLAIDILPKLAIGINVITDRYYLSSLAYQGLEMETSWIESINSYAKKPDLTVLIDTPVAISQKRMQRQRWHVELYEDVEQLEKVRQKYLAVATELTKRGERIVAIDGRDSIQAVQREVVRAIQGILSKSRSRTRPLGQLTFAEP